MEYEEIEITYAMKLFNFNVSFFSDASIPYSYKFLNFYIIKLYLYRYANKIKKKISCTKIQPRTGDEN